MFDDKIKFYAAKHGIPEDIALRQVYQESRGNPRAVSPKGAAGLLQITSATAGELGLTDEDRFDPDKNLDAGFRYLSQQLRAHNGDMGLALAAYNAGAGNVRKYKGIPPFKETQGYVAAIMGPGYSRPPVATKLTPRQKEEQVAADFDAFALDTAPAPEQDPVTQQSAAALSNKLAAGVADASDGLLLGFSDSLTAGLLDQFALSGERDSQFLDQLRAGAYKDTIQASGIAGTDLEDYVLGAANEEDLTRRIQRAEERQRMTQAVQNTGGWSGVGVKAAQFVGNVADPVAFAGALATAPLYTGLRAGLAVGAVEGAGYVAATDALNNRDISHENLMLGAVLGSVLGGVAGAIGRRGAGHPQEDAALSLSIERQPPTTADGVPTPDVDTALPVIASPAAAPAPVAGLPDGPIARAFGDGSDSPVMRTGNARSGGEYVPVSTDFKASLRAVVETTANPTFRAVAKKLEQALADMDIKFNQMDAPHMREANGSLTTGGRAWTPIKTETGYEGHVFVRHAEQGLPVETLLHEGIHLATLTAIGARQTSAAGRNAQQVVASMDSLYQEVLADAAKRGQAGVNGLKNLKEFAADVVNGDFRTLVDQPTPGILGKLKELGNALLRWLGIGGKNRIDDYLRSVFDTIDADGALRREVRAPVVAAAPDYSFGGAFANSPMPGSGLTLTAKAQQMKDKAAAWDDTIDPATEANRAKLKPYYDQMRPGIINKGEEYLDSPGLLVQKSKSKVARYWGAHLMEDGTGLGKRVNNTAAMEATVLDQKWRHQYIPALRNIVLESMSWSDKLAYAFGSLTKRNQISYEVAVERQARREAVKAGTQYQSTAPSHIQKLADQVDAFFEDALNTAKANGVEQAAASLNIPGKHHGFMPYEWNWQELNRLHVEEPGKFQSIVSLMSQQYLNDVVRPSLQHLTDVGPMRPEDLAAIAARAEERTQYLVSAKLQQIMTNPESRMVGQENLLAGMAEEVLLDAFRGTRVTDEMAGKVREALTDILSDRSRREMNLLTQLDGVRLLDVMRHDMVEMVESASRMYSGRTALARKGIMDEADAQAVIAAARDDGATVLEQQALDFGLRSLGMGSLRNGKESKVATALRDGAHMIMMGKLGFSILAELPMAAATLGHASVLRQFPRAFRRSPVMRQMAVLAPALSGLEHRIHSLSGVEFGTRAMDTSSRTLNLLRRGRQATDWLSGANIVSMGMHNAVVPLAIHTMVESIKGTGRFTAMQLKDMGLDEAAVARLRTQVQKHDRDYKLGNELNLEKWDTKDADDFLLAAHRVVGNMMTRAHVGERPMWHVESDLGALFVQFKGAGYIAAEKQTMRVISQNDAGRLSMIGGFALSFGTLLHLARTEASTIGMTDAQEDAFWKQQMDPMRFASGVAVMTNMSGMIPDGMSLIGLLTGTAPSGGSSVAGLQFLKRAQEGLGAPADLVTGDPMGALNRVLKLLPGANSIPVLTAANLLGREDE